MPQISQALLDAINKAEVDLAAAKDADTAQATATAALATATDASVTAHKIASDSTSAAFTLFKTELQIP